MNEVYNRKAPKSNKICGVKMNGGVTKGFHTLSELARYIYGEYGETWRDNVRTKDDSGSKGKTAKQQLPKIQTASIPCQDMSMKANSDMLSLMHHEMVTVCIIA